MKRILGFGALAMWALMGLAGPTNAAYEESRIAIVSPANGDDVYDTFDLKYKMEGLRDSKADVYLDGTKQYGFDGTFRGLTKGQHWITVMPSRDAKKADTDTITVEVK